MSSIKCSVALVNDKSRMVVIEIIKEKPDKLLWKVIKSAGGNLRLSADDGTWEIFGDMLMLWYETTGKERKKMVPGYTKLPTLVLHSIKDDFVDEIISNGKTIEDNEASLYNDNPAEKIVSCKLGRIN